MSRSIIIIIIIIACSCEIWLLWDYSISVLILAIHAEDKSINERRSGIKLINERSALSN